MNIENLPIQCLGNECAFYIPLEKLHLVEKILHDYFIENHNAYSVEVVGVNGFWRMNCSSEILQEKHVKYVCGIAEDKIREFVIFLSGVCSLIKEYALYMTMCHKSWLVTPEEQ